MLRLESRFSSCLVMGCLCIPWVSRKRVDSWTCVYLTVSAYSSVYRAQTGIWGRYSCDSLQFSLFVWGPGGRILHSSVILTQGENILPWNTRQLPMGAGHCPWDGYTDWIVCNIHGEEEIEPEVLPFQGCERRMDGQFLRKYIWIWVVQWFCSFLFSLWWAPHRCSF